MTKFIDKNGDEWKVHLTLAKSRQLANVGPMLDVFNFADLDRLSQSIGLRLEYLYYCCREKAAELDVVDLDDFASRLMSTEETANKASDALQEALVSFFRRLGQTMQADLAEEYLIHMKAEREKWKTEGSGELKKLSAKQLAQRMKAGKRSRPSPQLQD